MGERRFGTYEAASLYSSSVHNLLGWLRNNREKNAQKIMDAERDLKQVEQEMEAFREFSRKMGGNQNY